MVRPWSIPPTWEALLPGSQSVQYGQGIAVDSSGNAYVTGIPSNVFPTVNPLQPTNRGQNAFVAKISPANVPGVSLNPLSITFGAQAVGTPSAIYTVTLLDVGSAPLTISKILASGDFSQTNTCGARIDGGSASCTISVTFTPTAGVARTGVLTITDNSNGVSGSQQTVALAGTGIGTAVSVAPSSLGFAAATVGTTSAARIVTLTNEATNPLTMGSVTASGDFSVSANSCGGSVAALKSCTISVQFKPTQTGARTGSLTINDSDVSSPQSVSLSGTGTGVSLSPATTTFSTEWDGTTSPAKTITLGNLSTSTISLPTPAAILGANAADFSITGGTCASSLAGKSSCTYTVTFTPSQVGAETATLSVNDADGTQTATLNGTGTP